MSYNTLPRIRVPLEFELQLTFQKTCFTGHTLFFYLEENNKLFQTLNNTEDVKNIMSSINQYEYIYEKVPGSSFSVSKLKPFSNTFYELLDINYTLNIFDFYTSIPSIQSFHFGPNHLSTIECLNTVREECNDLHNGFEGGIYNYENNEKLQSFSKNSADFMFFELEVTKNEEINEYVYELLKIISIVHSLMKPTGTCIIQIDHIFYKPIVEVIFILSNIFDKVTIMKPNVSNVFSHKKYIICKNYIKNEDSTIEYEALLNNIKKVKDDSLTIQSILKNNLSYYFLNRIEETNIMIGQQQLEFYNQLVSMVKNKNREDKIENIKHVNIQKSVYWCEKYRIPYNKFPEKYIFNTSYEDKCDFPKEKEKEKENVNVTDDDISTFAVNYVLNNFSSDKDNIIDDINVD